MATFLIFISVIFFHSCLSDRPPNLDTPKDLPSFFPKPGRERSEFDLALFGALNKFNNTNANIVFSPVSVRFALLMVSEGAGGDSAKQIQNAVRSAGTPYEKSIDVVHYMKPQKRKVIVKISNGIFLSHNYTVNNDYFKKLKQNYLADVRLVNMEKSKETAALINSWFKNKTHNGVAEIVNETNIKKGVALYVGSAAYFKGVWKYKFRKNLTFRRCFYEHGKDCSYTQMMINIGEFEIGDLKDLEAKAVQLFYKDNKHSLVIILPNTKEGVDDLIEKLQDEQLDNIASRLKRRRVLVELPKFKIDSKFHMSEALKSLGIWDIFSATANLTAMVTSGEGLKINEFVHAAKVSVFERGSQLGSSTGEEATLQRAPPDYEEFVVEHPFVFFIRETSTSAILFAGKMTSPGLDTKY